MHRPCVPSHMCFRTHGSPDRKLGTEPDPTVCLQPFATDAAFRSRGATGSTEMSTLGLDEFELIPCTKLMAQALTDGN